MPLLSTELFKEKLSINIVIKKIKWLVTSFDIFFKYKTKVLIGTFRFGGEYRNDIFVKLKNKTIEVNRLFSPPDNINLNIKTNRKNKVRILK